MLKNNTIKRKHFIIWRKHMDVVAKEKKRKKNREKKEKNKSYIKS
jgi:hypothetical protein